MVQGFSVVFMFCRLRSGRERLREGERLRERRVLSSCMRILGLVVWGIGMVAEFFVVIRISATIGNTRVRCC